MPGSAFQWRRPRLRISRIALQARHGRADSGFQIRRRPWRRIWRIALQARPRSADRTRSPAAISQKREFFKCPPETYPLFRSENAQNRSPETGGQFAKARHWRAFLRVSGTVSPKAGLPGWGGRIRTSRWRIGNRTLSPVREKPHNLFPVTIISNSKRSNFENRTESTESRDLERNGPFGE